MSTLSGVQEAARDRGYLVSAVTLRVASRAALTEAMEHLSAWGVEGIIAITPQREAVRALTTLQAPCPVVTVEGGHDLDLPGVSLDQELGARMITEHLLASGHSTVWHVASTTGLAGERSPYRRVGGRAPRCGGAGPGTAARRLGPDVRVPGRTAARRAGRLLAPGVRAHRGLRGQRPDGARGVARPARGGFPDTPGRGGGGVRRHPRGGVLPPPLTTVRQDFAALGRNSIALLLEHIEGTATGTAHRTVAPELIVRASTARRQGARPTG